MAATPLHLTPEHADPSHAVARYLLTPAGRAALREQTPDDVAEAPCDDSLASLFDAEPWDNATGPEPDSLFEIAGRYVANADSHVGRELPRGFDLRAAAASRFGIVAFAGPVYLPSPWPGAVRAYAAVAAAIGGELHAEQASPAAEVRWYMTPRAPAPRPALALHREA